MTTDEKYVVFWNEEGKADFHKVLFVTVKIWQFIDFPFSFTLFSFFLVS